MDNKEKTVFDIVTSDRQITEEDRIRKEDILF